MEFISTTSPVYHPLVLFAEPPELITYGACVPPDPQTPHLIFKFIYLYSIFHSKIEKKIHIRTNTKGNSNAVALLTYKLLLFLP